MLHITNGDSAAETIKDVVFSGQILAWRDVLHEGPVPANLSLAQLSQVRAEFIAAQGWGNRLEIEQSFAERDQLLSRFQEQDEVVLWFEHDLYDQLQLLQILAWFAECDLLIPTKLKLICINESPGVQPFFGLGQLNANQLAALYPQRTLLAREQIKLGRAAWEAFTASEPTEITTLLAGKTLALPFLHNALLRHLQQFPSNVNGLGRSEQQILAAIAAGNHTPSEIFHADQAMEEAVFMGDSTFWSYLKRLCEGAQPLLKVASGAEFFLPLTPSDKNFLAQKLVLTDTGRAVLAGQADQIKLNGIDRWFGGVHLQGQEIVWRWDGEKLMLSHIL